MSHNYPYRCLPTDSDLRPDPGPFSSADLRHTSTDNGLYRSPQESFSSSYPSSSRDHWMQDSTLSILNSCGLEPSDLALLAELPEEVLSVESLPQVLKQIKGKRGTVNPFPPRALASSSSSSSSSSSAYPHSSAHQPAVSPSVGDWDQPCSQLVQYPKGHLTPSLLSSDLDRWGNPRTTNSFRGDPEPPPPPPSSSSSSSSYHRPGPSKYGKTGRDIGPVSTHDYSQRSGPPEYGKAGRDIGSVSPNDYNHRSGPIEYGTVSDTISSQGSFSSAGGDNRTRPSHFSQLRPADRRSAPPSEEFLQKVGGQRHNTETSAIRISSQLVASIPSKKEALDFHGTTPLVYPYSCSLCAITVMSERVWLKHINGTHHADGQLSLLQRFPNWDCRMETVSRADGQSEKWKDKGQPDPKPQTANQSSNVHPAGTQKKASEKGKVVCVRFPANSVDETYLRKLAEPFGKIVRILMFPSLAFLELGSIDQAKDLVKYHINYPAAVNGEQMEFMISSTFSFLQSCQVVSFTPAPSGENGKSDLISIVKRFGMPLYTLFLPSMAFVEMKNPPDAQKLVDYYSSNTLRINSDVIKVSFSGEYKTLMRVALANRYEEETRSSSREKEEKTMESKKKKNSKDQVEDKEEGEKSNRERKVRSRSRSREKSTKEKTISSRSKEKSSRDRRTRTRSRSTERSREKSHREKRSRSRDRSSRDRRARTRSRSREKSCRDRTTRSKSRDKSHRDRRTRTRSRSRDKSRQDRRTSTRSRSRDKSSRDRSTRTRSMSRDKSSRDRRTRTRSMSSEKSSGERMSRSSSRGKSAIPKKTQPTDTEFRTSPNPAPVRDLKPEAEEREETEEEEDSSAEESDIEGMEVIGEDGENLEDEDMETLDDAEKEEDGDDEDTMEEATECTDSPEGDKETELKDREADDQEQQEKRVTGKEEFEKEEPMKEGQEEPEEEVVVEVKQEMQDDQEEPDFPVDLENCITLDELEEDQFDEKDEGLQAEQKSSRVVCFRNLPLCSYPDTEFTKLVRDFGTAVRYFHKPPSYGFIEMSTSSEAQRAVKELTIKPVIFYGHKLTIQMSDECTTLPNGWKVPLDNNTEKRSDCRSRSSSGDRKSRDESNRTSKRRKESPKKTPEKQSPSKKTRDKKSASKTASKNSSQVDKHLSEERTALGIKSGEESVSQKTPEEQSFDTSGKSSRTTVETRTEQNEVSTETMSATIKTDYESLPSQENQMLNRKETDEDDSVAEKKKKGSRDQTEIKQELENAEAPADEKMAIKEQEGSVEMPGPGQKDSECQHQPQPARDPPKPQTEQDSVVQAEQQSKPTGGTAELQKPTKPVGTEYVRPVVGYFCNLCQLIYADEDEAKLQHCSSLTHYRKYQEKTGKDPWAS